MSPIAVIDFETTGISPHMGDRATEVDMEIVHGSSKLNPRQVSTG